MIEQKPDNRTKIVGLVIGAIVIFLLGIAVGGSDQENTTTQPVTDTSKPTEAESKPKQKTKSAPKPIKLSGASQAATQPFHLEEGLAVFKMTHQGDSNFAINLLDENGENIDLLVNEIGVFNGSKAERIDISGDYVLDVQANGPWTVTITQQ